MRMSPISNAERQRRRNNRLRAAAQRQSARRAVSQRRQSPPKRRNSPRRSIVTGASLHPPKRFEGAVAHTIAPNGAIYYLMPQVPSGKVYNFSRPLPFKNVNVSARR